MPDAWPLLLVLGAIAAGCLLDRLPARSFYSRRAFEPPVRTYAELEHELDVRQELEPSGSLRGEVSRYGRGPVRRGLPASSGWELEPW